jgi:hypothetical protein
LSYPYKPNPQPDGTIGYLPVVQVQLKKGSVTTTPFEAIVDSGSELCIFHGGIANALKISDVTEGPHSTVGGIVPRQQVDLYEHEVRLIIGSDEFKIMAYFSPQLEIPGLLGRRGFFDKFVVTFDPATGSLDLKRFHGHN